MSNDGGVSTLGVKTIPRRPGLQGCARAGWGWGHTQGDGDTSPWPGGVGSSSQILPALAGQGTGAGPRGQGLLCRRRCALACWEGWGTGVEFLPRKEGWCGGKVGRYNINIQVIAVEGKEGVSGGI